MKKLLFTVLFVITLQGLSAQSLTLYKNESNQFGFKDQSGTIIVEPLYDNAQAFAEDLAAVESNMKWGFVDKTGSIVIPIKYDAVSSFKAGKAKVTIGNKTFYIDKKGKQVK